MPAPPHTDNILRSFIAEIRKHGSVNATARATGISRGTWTSRVVAIKERFGIHPLEFDANGADKPRVRVKATSEPVPLPTLTERIEIAALKASILDLKRTLSETETALRHDRHALKSSAELREMRPETIEWEAGEHPEDSPGIPMFLWSDWHVGETVDPEQVYHYNRYNKETCFARVQSMVERSIYLSTKHIANPDTESAVIILGGDFVSGWLHEELIATDWCTPLQATHQASGLLCAAIKRMREVFSKLTIVCVPGNHGRLMKRPPGKMGAYQSFDWLIYSWLSEQFADDSAIEMIIPASGDYNLKVYNTRYNIQHGHELGVKGGDGLIGSIGPMMRGRQKAGRAGSSLGREFDIMVLGHFHQDLWLASQGLIVNNCLIGYNEYAKKQKYVAAPPSQKLWFTHPRMGAVCPIEVFTEE